MSKNLIIFGAGASIGSEENNMPPLGNTLFDELVLFDPNGWGQIPEELAMVFCKDFELGMKELSVRYTNVLTQIQIRMAKFFFKFQPTNSSLYFKLAKRIIENEWSGSISTLNYERLLDISLKECSTNTKISTKYLSRN